MSLQQDLNTANAYTKRDYSQCARLEEQNHHRQGTRIDSSDLNIYSK